MIIVNAACSFVKLWFILNHNGLCICSSVCSDSFSLNNGVNPFVLKRSALNKQLESSYFEKQFFLLASAASSQTYFFQSFNSIFFFNLIITYVNYQFIQIIKTFLSSLLTLTLFMSFLISSINLFALLKSFLDSNHSGNSLSAILNWLGLRPSFLFKARSL